MEHHRSEIEELECLSSLTTTTKLSVFHRKCPLACEVRPEDEMRISRMDNLFYSIINPTLTASLLTFRSSEFTSNNLVNSTPLFKKASPHGSIIVQVGCNNKLFIHPQLSILPEAGCSHIETIDLPPISVLFPTRWSNEDADLLELLTLQQTLIREVPVNLTSMVSFHAINKDLSIKYAWYKAPTLTSFGDLITFNHYHLMRYAELSLLILLTLILLYVWITQRVNSHHYSGHTVPVMTALLSQPSSVAALSSDQLTLNFIYFLSVLGIINVIFVVCTMLVLCFVFKRKWIRNARKYTNPPGCDWMSVPVDEPSDVYRPSSSTRPNILKTTASNDMNQTPKVLYPRIHNYDF